MSSLSSVKTEKGTTLGEQLSGTLYEQPFFCENRKGGSQVHYMSSLSSVKIEKGTTLGHTI